MRSHNTGLKHFRHPVVGTIDLAYDSLDVRSAGDDVLVLTGYTAAVGSPADRNTYARQLGGDGSAPANRGAAADRRG